MFGRVHLFRASWTLIDQGVVSLGSFAANIMLARLLPNADYGVFALIFALLLLLQVFNTTLIFYPFTIRVAAAVGERIDMIWSSLSLLVVALLPLMGTVSIGLMIFGEGDLIPSVLTWFALWQVQETLRRVLFAEFRHRAAVIGDAVTYFGQAAGVLILALGGMLTLPAAFFAFAAASAVGACIQFIQVGAAYRRPDALGRTAKDYWSIGRWSLASSLVTALRFNALIWMVGLVAGRSHVADFQAAFNVVNVINPVMVGLCNLIPQTAAHASSEGVGTAWRAVRHYASLGFLPTAAYYAFVMASPATMLWLLYGSGSRYLEAADIVQILGAALLFNYISEMACSFLHGINSPRTALNINLVGMGIMVVAFFPLAAAFGLPGAAIALALANGIRLLFSFFTLKRLVLDADAHPA
ncbi:lipopolysaccharide biosynthesis protein [Pseudorhodoplanes sp.]|uniref:lipopolysaccharide biosynthesis protein n=1 Tax=Pseudorhodoplanes sp. TaxID=1934341 RepID=UPI002C6ECB08|nr:polysaccharide biosynthesis C-terminal domain-containing protein [Pseudorhodoplanes sp.]HWV41637.1 polysaccharide biosynthesis C-terminal domain-containing protein [Pseudorhodoplanes sp.]